MTRNIVVLAALDACDDATASTEEIATYTSLPDRTVRRAVRSLINQGLVWCPARGFWQLTPAGLDIAKRLRPADTDRESPVRESREEGPSDPTLLEALWAD